MLESLFFYVRIWTVPLAASAVGIGLYGLVAWAILRYEWGEYAPTKRVRSWIVMHLFSPAFAVAGYYAAALPASGVSGMEGLGVFYGLLITVAPLAYFTGHVILGRLILSPEISVRESMIIAATSIAIFGGLAMTAGFVTGKVTAAHRHAARIDVRGAVAAESPFLQTRLIRFAMPDGETLIYATFSKKHVMDRFRLDLFYSTPAGRRISASLNNHACLCGDQLHLVFVAEKGGVLPRLRCHWRRDGSHRTFVAEFGPDMDHGLERPFRVEKSGDTLHLPVPLPHAVVQPVRLDGRPVSIPWLENGCGTGGCLNETLTPAAPVTSLRLRLWRPGLERSERHVFTFPLP